MRTTIRLDDQLLAEAKELALQTDRTLTAVIEDALREVLSRRRDVGEHPRIALMRDGEGGPRPGVNISSNAELLERMDDADVAP